jgi:WD40 repeat protein
VIGRSLGLTAVVLALAAAGCKKDKESLVVVTLSADASDTAAKDMTSVVLSISDGTHSVAKSFALVAGTGIPSTAPYVSFGAYVDSEFTGGVTITATASQPGSCVGESGTKGTKINVVGAEAPPVTIGMKPNGNVCTTDGGAAGTAGGAAGASGGAAGRGGTTGTGGVLGAAGTTGSAGTTGAAGTTGTAGTTGMAGTTGAAGTTGTAGTTGGGGTTPTLVNCIEINHDSNTSACSDSCTSTDDIAVYGAAFSPKNSQLFVTGGTDGRVKVWTIANGTATAQGKVLTGMGLGVVAFSPDGTLLAVGRVGGIEIWNVANWTLLRTLTVSYEVFGVAFSPDGTEVISFDHNANATTSNDSTLYVHAVGTLAALHSLAFAGGFALAVSPVGSVTSLPVAVSTIDGEALVYTLTASGFVSQSTLTVTEDGSYAETIQFSPQGTLLASGGDDGLLHFWTLPTSTGAAPTSPDIDIFADTIFSTETYSLAFWPTGNYIAVGGGGYADFSGSGSLSAWAVASPRAEVGTEYDTANSYDVVSVSVAPDASFIVGGEGDCGCVIACRQ